MVPGSSGCVNFFAAGLPIILFFHISHSWNGAPSVDGGSSGLVLNKIYRGELSTS
jgi:hypothetical protein